MANIARKPRLHQCPGCWSYGLHMTPEDGWIECNCGERMTVVDLRDATDRGAVEENERLRAALRWYAIGEHLPHPDHSARAQAALRSTTGGQ